jgi:hypothetical protein
MNGHTKRGRMMFKTNQDTRTTTTTTTTTKTTTTTTRSYHPNLNP